MTIYVLSIICGMCTSPAWAEPWHSKEVFETRDDCEQYGWTVLELSGLSDHPSLQLQIKCDKQVEG
jgi:hypothetical protein